MGVSVALLDVFVDMLPETLPTRKLQMFRRQRSDRTLSSRLLFSRYAESGARAVLVAGKFTCVRFARVTDTGADDVFVRPLLADWREMQVKD